MKHIHGKQSDLLVEDFHFLPILVYFYFTNRVFQSKTSDPVSVVGMQPERSNSGLNTKLHVKPVFMYEASEASPWQRSASSPFSITINDFISSVFFYFASVIQLPVVIQHLTTSLSVAVGFYDLKLKTRRFPSSQVAMATVAMLRSGAARCKSQTTTFLQLQTII